MRVRIYGVQPGHGRTSRSVCSLGAHAPYSIGGLSGWDSRGKNTAALVASALFHLLAGIKKAPRGCSREAALYAVLLL